MPSGIIVAETAPDRDNRYAWFQPSTGKWFELSPDASEWVEKLDETDKAPLAHTHTELENLNITGVLSAAGDAGLTGSRTIQGYTLTFKKGLLVGFEAP